MEAIETEKTGVTVSEIPALVISEILKSEGYLLCSSIGVREYEPSIPFDSVGILKQVEPIKKRFLWFTINYTPSLIWLGVIWINNLSRGADKKRLWIFEVHGEENIREAIRISWLIQKRCGIDINISKISTRPRREQHISDYC